MALAVLKIKLAEKITLYELYEAGCLQMPSLSAAQSMIIIVGLKEKFSVQSVSSLVGTFFNFSTPFFPFLFSPIKMRISHIYLLIRDC